MMGRLSRSKGRRGQTIFTNMLKARDWSVAELAAGFESEDLIAVDPMGRSYACEVKNQVVISADHRKQAIEQGNKRKLPWMLASKISGTDCWLVQRKGQFPAVWAESGRSDDVQVTPI